MSQMNTEARPWRAGCAYTMRKMRLQWARIPFFTGIAAATAYLPFLPPTLDSALYRVALLRELFR